MTSFCEHGTASSGMAMEFAAAVQHVLVLYTGIVLVSVMLTDLYRIPAGETHNILFFTTMCGRHRHPDAGGAHRAVRIGAGCRRQKKARSVERAFGFALYLSR
ncbi:hypothetical protein [Pseudodesulfovibrio tunisiensis]|uniref:hypothetical protein n=1 Tax=Pseudodesulfovibrio tunisiensis TaxID=463192 RepID=UPI001FB1E5C0|nr:hypothetical protein [Pseudodesulfovibrio tunisiensis]